MTKKDMIMYGWMTLITVLLVVGMVGGNNQPSVGGSTSSDWNVGGDLSVAGTSSFTGALTSTGTLTVTGATDVGIFTQGGGCTASTTAAAAELWTEADLLAANCFTYSGTVALASAAITITFPATSTMTTLLPNAGDTRLFFYDPAGYAAATTTTFAAGTGIILMEPDGQNVVIAGATSAAWITMVRLSNTDVSVTVDEVVDAD